MGKSSGGERAWFLEEDSEPRNKRIYHAGEYPRADELACLAVFKTITKMEILTTDTTDENYLTYG
ncbi:MAG: hypothetical protein JSV96_07815 [Candidatus Aminicenantes bacterium]|nr:MAG: hypothetical protein JSV96_07815 [Candidatus Aminicenantes bacterium]